MSFGLPDGTPGAIGRRRFLALLAAAAAASTLGADTDTGAVRHRAPGNI
jgi:hypothetical protein